MDRVDLGPSGREYSLEGVVPPTTEQTELEALPSVIDAKLRCEGLLGDSEVSVVEDECIKSPVVELWGPEAEVVFAVEAILPLLVLHVKSSSRFVWLEIETLDSRRRKRKFSISNKSSIVSIEDNEAKLPLLLEDGWQRLCFDLPKLTKTAFGSRHFTTYQITIRGSITISKIFFQEQDYADAELPDAFRALSH